MATCKTTLPLGFPALVPCTFSFFIITSLINQACSVKMIGYIGLGFLFNFFAFLHRTQKTNLANIQPAWSKTPHAWSITHICTCIAGIFFPTVRALIGYFEVTWHLTMKLFLPAKISERGTLQNLWRQRVTMQCLLPRMLTARKIYFHKFVGEKVFFLVGYNLYNKWLKDWSLGKLLILLPSANIETLGKQN